MPRADGMQYLETSWTLEFQGHPPGPNEKRKLHWTKLAKITDHWHELTGLQVLIVGVPKLTRIRLRGVVIRPRLGVADQSNDAGRFKEIEDGLVMAGVVPKDTYAHVEWVGIREERGPKAVRVEIEAVG